MVQILAIFFKFTKILVCQISGYTVCNQIPKNINRCQTIPRVARGAWPEDETNAPAALVCYMGMCTSSVLIGSGTWGGKGGSSPPTFVQLVTDNRPTIDGFVTESMEVELTPDTSLSRSAIQDGSEVKSILVNRLVTRQVTPSSAYHLRHRNSNKKLSQLLVKVSALPHAVMMNTILSSHVIKQC